MAAIDAVATMGNVLPNDAGGRDAVHVAVFSAVADTPMFPGQDVAVVEHLDNGDTKVKVQAAENDAVGIIDPFLKEMVIYPRQRFWVYLYPRSISGLSHHWTHPAFDKAPGVDAQKLQSDAQKLQSKEWLKDYCETHDCPSYNTMMQALHGIFTNEDGVYRLDVDYTASVDHRYLYFSGWDAHGEIVPEFWDHVQNVLGIPIKVRPTYFSCSC